MGPIIKDPRYIKPIHTSPKMNSLFLDLEGQRDLDIWSGQLESLLRRRVRSAAQANVEAIYLMHSLHCIDGKTTGSRVAKRLVWHHPPASNGQLDLEPGSLLQQEVSPLPITARLDDEITGHLIARTLQWAERWSSRAQCQTSSALCHWQKP